jgi:hypothetical protein
LWESVPLNALVLIEPINLETIVSKVVWSAAGRNAPQPSDSPETRFEEIEARSTLRGGASFPPGLLNRNSFPSTQGSRDNPPK